LFRKVALPLARPAIAVGVALALLEALNDIGASEFLGVQTLTVSIYTTWVSRGDLPGAAQIALAMLLLVAALLMLEKHGRRRQRYASTLRPRPMQQQTLRGAGAALAFALGALPVVVGFLVPATYLAWEAIQRVRVAGVSPQLWGALQNTLGIALAATVVVMVVGLAVAWALRLAQVRRKGRLASACSRITSLGYAIPGTVLAIGLLVPMGALDALFAELRFAIDGGRAQMLLMGSATALVVAYTLRFLAISVGGIEAGLARVPQSLDQAAANLGESAGGMLRRVHLPLLRPAFAAAALLVFVDTMKELPATLVLRPMNFETLATWLYAEAARGTYEEGAVAALLIVLSGLLPVILLARAGAAHGARP
jgi:iron(III) transport system permease protein